MTLWNTCPAGLALFSPGILKEQASPQLALITSGLKAEGRGQDSWESEAYFMHTDPCASWLKKVVREGLLDCLGSIVTASLTEGNSPEGGETLL